MVLKIYSSDSDNINPDDLGFDDDETEGV